MKVIFISESDIGGAYRCRSICPCQAICRLACRTRSTQLTVWLINRKSRRITLISYAGCGLRRSAVNNVVCVIYGKINRRDTHTRDAIFVANSKFTYREINNCDVAVAGEIVQSQNAGIILPRGKIDAADLLRIALSRARHASKSTGAAEVRKRYGPIITFPWESRIRRRKNRQILQSRSNVSIR